MTKLLITNGKIITWGYPNRILEGSALLVENDRIARIDDQKTLLEQLPGVEKLNANGQFVMPGLICAHTHFYGAFSRGMSIPGDSPRDFPEILEKLWWPLDLALDEDAIKYSVLVCLVDAIRHGTTTLVDHHASPNMIEGSLDIIADAVEHCGARAALCYEVTDRNGNDGAMGGIDENLRFIKRVATLVEENSRVAAMFGLHASLTLTERTLDACRQAAPAETGFHIHVAEHEVDEQDSIEKYGMRVIKRLEKHQMLGPDTLLVHGVHLNEDEISIIGQTGSWLSHQPRSNMNNGVGLPAIQHMLERGVKVCLGNDGFSNTMWDEWKAVYLAHKLNHRDPRVMGGAEVIQMGAYHNAELATKLFNTPIGVLAEGAQADIIIVDYHPFTPLTEANLPWHIIFGFHESMVTATMVAGQLLMKDRILTKIDEEVIAAHALESAKRVWTRYNQECENKNG